MNHGLTIRPLICAAAAAAAILVFCAVPAAGQFSNEMSSASPAIQTFAQSQSAPLSGSVPSDAATSQVLQLSLADAIHRGFEYNLGSTESGADERMVRGRWLLALNVEQMDGLSATQLDLTALPHMRQRRRQAQDRFHCIPRSQVNSRSGRRSPFTGLRATSYFRQFGTTVRFLCGPTFS
jgi:hypothetical protein